MKNAWEIGRKEEGILGRGNRMYWDMGAKEDMVYAGKQKQPLYFLWHIRSTQRKGQAQETARMLSEEWWCTTNPPLPILYNIIQGTRHLSFPTDPLSAPQHEWTQVPDVPQAASEGNHGTDLGPYFWHHWTGRVVCRQAGIPWSLIKTPYRLFLWESWSKQPRSLTFPHQAPLLYSQIYQTHLFIQGYFCIPTSVHEPEEEESDTVLSLKCFYSSRIFLNPLIHSFNKYDSAPTVCQELCKC